MVSSLLPVVLQSGLVPSLPTILVGLLVLAAIIVVGRVVLAVAWRLVIVALLVAAGLWLLGTVGINVL